MFDDLKNNLHDYFSQFKFNGENVQGLIFMLIGLIMFISPMLAIHHYSKQINQYQADTVRNNNAARDLTNKAHQKVKYAKIQEMNAPQTQKKINEQVDQIVKAQTTMIQYQEKRIKNEDDKNKANTIMSRVLDDNAPLTKTNGMLLMAPFVYGNTTDITVKAGYTPQYSITQTHIHLMFKYLYKNKYPIYLTDATYNLKDHKIDNIMAYQTKNTTIYVINPSSVGVTESEYKARQQKAKKAKEEAKKKKQEAAKKAKQAKQNKAKAKKSKNKKKGGKK